MTASVQSPADLANVALARMGYKLRVGSLYDGSQASKKLLDIYGQTRDELLREHDWDFAERNVALTLLKQASVLPGGGYGYIPPNTWNPLLNPPPGYNFEYLYPSDCIKIRSLKPIPLFSPNFDPKTYRWTVANDNQFSPTADNRVILCDVANALLTYTGQETSPVLWDVGFVKAFAAALGQHLGPALVGLQSEQLLTPEDQRDTVAAEMEQG